ncbi:hypothetical protein NQZ68_026820 [Dissostichus eleginoides]|nr:hypothetical protein NQZ68_026820 [Dissostichus eleginoides]
MRKQRSPPVISGSVSLQKTTTSSTSRTQRVTETSVRRVPSAVSSKASTRKSQLLAASQRELATIFEAKNNRSKMQRARDNQTHAPNARRDAG